MNGHEKIFHLEITSIAEFAAFVAIIRNEDISRIPELTAKLQKSTEALSAAEKADAAGQPKKEHT